MTQLFKSIFIIFYNIERSWFLKGSQAPSMHCSKDKLCGYSYKIVVCWLYAIAIVVVFVITDVYLLCGDIQSAFFTLRLWNVVIEVSRKCWSLQVSV